MAGDRDAAPNGVGAMTVMSAQMMGQPETNKKGPTPSITSVKSMHSLHPVPFCSRVLSTSPSVHVTGGDPLGLEVGFNVKGFLRQK